jgi:hypothetical protein
MMRLYAFDRLHEKAWVFNASDAWVRRHDNGSLVSIGISVPDELSHKQLKALGAKEVTWEKWKHSGCQSSCVLRGGTKCSW